MTVSVLLVGPEDRDLTAAFEALDCAVTRVPEVATADRLVAADVETADVLVLTSADDATAVPIARERNPDVRTVIYSPDGVPEFVRGQLDLALDPRVLDPSTVAEELVDAVP
ncbi:MAG: CTP synthetase [Halobacteriaceae archaeon]